EEVMAWAWRIPFLLGGVFGLLAVWLRRFLEETPVFEALRRRRELVAGLPLKQVLRGHFPDVVVSMLLTWMLTAGIVVVILMTPTLVQSLFAIPQPLAAAANTWATFFLCVGCVAFGHAADRFGATRVMLVGAGLLALSTAGMYRGLAVAPEFFVGLYALCGFCVGVVGVIPTVLVRAFPPAI